MAVTLEELQIVFKAEMAGVKEDLGRLKAQLKQVETSANTAKNAFASIGKALKAFVGVYAVRGMVNIGKSALQMANDAVESENLFTESMRGMSNAARQWSEELSRTTGLNAYTLRKNVGTFNVMFRSMGVSEEKAYEMSTTLTQLAEDMASFYNIPSEEAFNKLRSGITGEVVPLKQLGILVDDNTVKQYALAAGVQKTGEQMSQTEKLMARYTAIMAQTSTAQGDLERTINTPANQLRVLQQQLDMAKIKLGQAFLPIYTAAMPALLSLAQAATTAASAIAYLVGGVNSMAGVNMVANLTGNKGIETTKELGKTLNDTAKAYKKAGGAAKQAAKDAGIGIKHFDEVNKLTQEATESAKGGGGGGGAKIDEFEPPDLGNVEEWSSPFETVSRKVRELAEKIKEAWKLIEPALAGISAAFVAFKLTGNPAIAAAVGAIAAAITALKRAADEARQARLSEAFGSLEFSLEEAALLLRTETDDVLDAIAELSEKTDTAMQEYSQARQYTSKIMAIIKLLPNVTGKDIFFEELENLKKEIEGVNEQFEANVMAYLNVLYKEGKIDKNEYKWRVGKLKTRTEVLNKKAGDIETEIKALINAALEDGEVDDSKRVSIQAELQRKTKELVRGWKELEVEQIAQINADLEAGNISKEKAKEEIRKTEANIQEQINFVEAEALKFEAKIGNYNFTAEQLTPTQAAQLREAVEAEIEASEALITAQTAHITANANLILGEGWENNTVFGQGITTIFSGAQTIAAEESAKLQGLLIKGLEIGFTPELLNQIAESRANLDKAAQMVAGGLTEEGAWNKALEDLDLMSADSVDNFFQAFTDSITAGNEQIKKVGEETTNIWYNNKDEIVKAGYDFNAGIEEIRNGTEEQIAEFTSGKLTGLVAAIGPSLSAAFSSGELNLSDIQQYADKISEILSGIDYDSLTEGGKQAVNDLFEIFGDDAVLLLTGGVNELAKKMGDTFVETSAEYKEKAKEQWDKISKTPEYLLSQNEPAYKVAAARFGTVFFREVDEAYKNGIISWKEYGEIMNAAAHDNMEELAKTMGDGADEATKNFIDGINNSTGNTKLAVEKYGREFLNGMNEMYNSGVISQQEFAQIMNEGANGTINDVVSMLVTLRNNMKAGGNQSGADLVSGLLSQVENVRNAANKLGSTANTTVKKVNNLFIIGQNFANAFAKGLGEAKEVVVTAATNVANAAKNIVNKIFKVKSPSRVAIWQGEMYGEGLAIGIRSMTEDVRRAGKQLASTANATLGSNVFSKPNMGIDTNISSVRTLEINANDIGGAIAAGIEQGVARVMNSLQIALNVDGRELGKASIRAINNAQRSAGRILLEL